MLTGLKSIFKAALLSSGKAFMVLCYAPLKALPVDSRKILFLSRQSNDVSLDAALLIAELQSRCPDLKVVCICCRVEKTFSSKIRFMNCLLRSLYHLATSRVCVLDSYWPAVSTLKHKSELKVIQMWHALGKIKQSGQQALDRPGGRERRIANVLKMHQGYDFVIAGGEAWNRFYCESFGVSEGSIRNVGLPRIDYLLHNAESIRERIVASYPFLGDKQVILYAPTFRRVGGAKVSALLDAIDLDRFCVVAKPHPNQQIEADSRTMECPTVSAMELLTVAEYLVTDYSAISLEAAALEVKTIYYVHDYDLYRETTGVNIDLYAEMPGCVFQDADDIPAILTGEYPYESFERYREKYLYSCVGESTKAIADIVFYEAGLAAENEESVISCGAR